MLMHAISHGGCTDTVKNPTLKVDWEKCPLLLQGIEPVSASWLAFWSDTVPAKLSRPLFQLHPADPGDVRQH